SPIPPVNPLTQHHTIHAHFASDIPGPSHPSFSSLPLLYKTRVKVSSTHQDIPAEDIDKGGKRGQHRSCYRIAFSVPAASAPGELAALFLLNRFSAFILNRLGFFLSVCSPAGFAASSSLLLCGLSPSSSPSACIGTGGGGGGPVGAGTLISGTGALSPDSLLAMLVPRVLGESGILPAVALVACDVQSPEYGAELLPSVVSLQRCLLMESDLPWS